MCDSRSKHFHDHDRKSLEAPSRTPNCNKGEQNSVCVCLANCHLMANDTITTWKGHLHQQEQCQLAPLVPQLKYPQASGFQKNGVMFCSNCLLGINLRRCRLSRGKEILQQPGKAKLSMPKGFPTLTRHLNIPSCFPNSIT